MQHILGKPLYKEGDKVSFNFKFDSSDLTLCSGVVYIVDAYGTFEQDKEPSYDVMVDQWFDTGEKCLVKHIRESELVRCE